MPEMPDPPKLKSPWLVAVWPGMGQVAINAGYYLAAKLEMGVFAEFSPQELFDVEHVDVENGLVRPSRLPRSRLFLWRDPEEQRDLVLFIGEAQPPLGKRAFCRGLIDLARQLGVERIFTFAAMATRMHPEHPSRVFVASTDQETLDEICDLEVEVLKEGNIGGLNGVFLGEVAQTDMHGSCLLGEMPHLFAQLPFPGGSLAVLKIFRQFSGIAFEVDELEQQAQALGEKLGELLAQVEGELKSQVSSEEEPEEIEAPPEPKLSPAQEQQIDDLFAQAAQDRSKAYELKQLLDRFDVFSDYEDRFLDLFRKPED